LAVGLIDGDADGSDEGVELGPVDGDELGLAVGWVDGDLDGSNDGDELGSLDGDELG